MAEDKKVTKKASAPKAAKTAKSKAKASKKTKAAAPADKPVGDQAASQPKKKQGVATKRAPLIEKTYRAKWGEVTPEWKLVDATGQTLGRLSSNISRLLSGKGKTIYTPNADCGDFVVVINAEKVKLTGKKLTDKWYHYYTGYVGGVKSFTPKVLFEKHPERVLERAIFGMLPKTHLGRRWLKKLKVYAGPDHPHTAQNPVPVKIVP